MAYHRACHALSGMHDTLGGETEMTMNRIRIMAVLAIAGLGAAHAAQAEGRLGVYDAWIRAAPPGATMMAGYATLKNEGDAPVTVLTVQSDAFRMTSLHETIVVGEVAKMREIHRIVLAPGEDLHLRPGGRHLMLMQPRHEVAVGEKVAIRFMLADGQRIETRFEVLASDTPSD